MEGFILSLSVLRGRAVKAVKAPRGWENQGLSSCSLCLRTPPQKKNTKKYLCVSIGVEPDDGRYGDVVGFAASHSGVGFLLPLVLFPRVIGKVSQSLPGSTVKGKIFRYKTC